MFTNKYESGDVEIQKIVVTPIASGNGQSILPQVISISVYEDITQPVMYCEVLMTDTINLLKTIPIIGQETLELTFQVPSRDAFTAKFHVKHIGLIQTNALQSKKTYRLVGVSEERIMDAATIVEKGYKTTADAIIKDIVSSVLKSQKTVNVETPKGTLQLAFLRTSPFHAIDMIKARACSSTNKSSTYVFFENKNGFNFKTIEGLMKDGQSKIGDKIFVKYTLTADQLQSGLQFRAIVQHNTGSQFDIMGALDSGALNNIVQTYDIIGKNMNTSKYQLSDFSQFSTPDATGAISPFTPALNNAYGQTTPLKMFTLKDSTLPDTYINDFLPFKIGFLATHIHGMLDIHINGDSSINSGDVITCKFPSADGLTSNMTDDEKYTTGNYLVAKLHHYIQVSALKPKYTQSMSLMRGNYTQ